MAPCISRGMKIIAIPHAEEVSNTPSDTGSPISVLREEFNVDLVDLTHLKDEWFKHEGEFAIDAKAVNERARKLRKWIRDREEKEIVLVSHGFFNHFLTGDVDDKGVQTTPWWNEAELRTYDFGAEDDDQAMVYETKGSLIARGGMLEDGGNKFETLNQPAHRGTEAQPT